MRLLLVILSLIVVSCTSTEYTRWQTFKEAYGRIFTNSREEQMRLGVFRSNLRKIEEHNARYRKGEESYFLGITRFADLTPAEFESRFHGVKTEEPSTGKFFAQLPEDSSLPEAIDWRDKGAVLEVRDQGSCTTDWAFSSVGAIEGQNAIKHNQSYLLSPQQLIDCSTFFGTAGCSGGGDIVSAFQYFRSYGVQSESSYPYWGYDYLNASCVYQLEEAKVSVTGYRFVKDTEADLQRAVASVGPVVVNIRSGFLQHYAGGVFDDSSCNSQEMYNYLLVVGYGKEDDEEYWILKNSWGSSWGEQGYLRLKRNADNLCGIASEALYPLIQ